MASFDPIEQRMCVRVVYDGVANAGKTTNLRQLATLFSAGRVTEVHSPGELDGRTLYFDWLEIAAGVVCGFPLTCQLISVPGQVVLTPRRRHLLAGADVVVYVCDSSRSSLDRAREGLAVLDEVRASRPGDLPVVIQANKQDQPDAAEAEAVLRELDRTGLDSVAAIATDGIGVVDTFVAAVRTVSRAMRSRSDSGGLRVDVRKAPRAPELLASLDRQEVDPEWAAELLLEQAQSALALESMLARHPRPPAPTTHAHQPPSLPASDVPAGFVWPAHTGRAVLASLAEHPDARRPITFHERIVEQTIGERVASTHVDLRFPDRDEARQALVRAARARTQLETLLTPETVLVAQTASDGALWIWTVAPRLESIDGRARAGAERVRHELALECGHALVKIVGACLRHGLPATPSLAALGHDGFQVRFTGTFGRSAPVDAEIALALSSAIDDAPSFSLDAATISAEVGRRIHQDLSAEEVARLVAALPEGAATYGSLRRILANPADAA